MEIGQGLGQAVLEDGVVRGGVIDVVAQEVILLLLGCVPGCSHHIVETLSLLAGRARCRHKVGPGSSDGRQVGSGSFHSGVYIFSSHAAALFLSSDWQQ